MKVLELSASFLSVQSLMLFNSISEEDGETCSAAMLFFSFSWRSFSAAEEWQDEKTMANGVHMHTNTHTYNHTYTETVTKEGVC